MLATGIHKAVTDGDIAREKGKDHMIAVLN